MTNDLVKFESACRAVADAKTFYKVMEIRAKADTIRAFGKIAKDRSIEVDGIELRLIAERKLGEMIEEAPKNKGAAGGGEKTSPRGVYTTPRDKTPNLASQGIDKNLAKRARTLAKMPQAEFNGKVRNLRETVKDVAHRVVVKEFYKEKTKPPPLVNMNDLARRLLDWLDKTFDDDKSKIAAYISNLTKYSDQIGDDDAKKTLNKKL